MSEFKVALVAAASKEAAYLADWVFHHLRFGFAPIHVYVNRSNDGTEAMLRDLARSLPDLVVHNIDDVDQGGKGARQRTAYRRAIKQLRRAQSARDYTAFLDIDEFWTPRDFVSSVQEVLAAAGKPTCATFNWFQLVSDTDAFEPPFAPDMEGVHHQRVKPAFRSRTRYLTFDGHGIRPAFTRTIWNASGGQIIPKRWSMTEEAPQTHGTAFITHRLYRSQIEYLAILGRGRSNFLGIKDKKNRGGYHDLVHKARRVMPFAPPQEALNAYEADRLAFHADHNLEEAQTRARETVLERAKAIYTSYAAMDEIRRKEWARQFRWLDLKALESQLSLLP